MNRVFISGLVLWLSGCSPFSPATSQKSHIVKTEVRDFERASGLPVHRSPSARILSNYEIQNSIQSVFNIEIDLDSIVSRAQAEAELVFDHLVGTGITESLINELEAFADQVASAISKDVQRFLQNSGCSDLGVQCVTSYVQTMGLKIYRRPLVQSEVDRMMRLYLSLIETGASKELAFGDLNKAMILSSSFLYKFELGTHTKDIVNSGGVLTARTYELNNFEMASRLSYLVTGHPPDDSLLELASKGLLNSSDIRIQEVNRLLATDQARNHFARVFAKWLGYSEINTGDQISDDMSKESQLLVQEILFKRDGDIYDLFTADGTFINSRLGGVYDIQSPGLTANSFTWVPYEDGYRAGILSHGSFLSQGINGDPEENKYHSTRIQCV